jgi:hypothetical protein
MGALAGHFPPSETDDNGLRVEQKTAGERLDAKITVPEPERADLKRRYDYVAFKKKKTRIKTSNPKKLKAELRAEMARLEIRDIRTLQELRDTTQEVARLSIRSSYLKVFCRKYPEQTFGGETDLDEFNQAVSNLTPRFRERICRERPRHDAQKKAWASEPRVIRA